MASPSPNLELIRNALDTYAKRMNIDLKDNPFAKQVKDCNSVDTILQLLETNRAEFQQFRDNKSKFIDRLYPVVTFFNTFSGILGEATGLVSHKTVSGLSICSLFFF